MSEDVHMETVEDQLKKWGVKPPVPPAIRALPAYTIYILQNAIHWNLIMTLILEFIRNPCYDRIII